MKPMDVRGLMVATMALLISLPSSSHSQSVPSGAIEEANKILQQWVEWEGPDRNHVRRAWHLEESDPNLGEASFVEPYVLYQMTSWQLLEFERGSLEDVLSFARVYSYVFPLVTDGRVLGAIEVGRNENREGEKFVEEKGEYVNYGMRFPDSRVDEIVLELRKKYQTVDGYTISHLITHGAGHYFVISSNGRVTGITAANAVASNILSLEEGQKRGRYPIIPVLTAEPLVKNAIEQYRIRMQERQGAREENR